MLQRAASNANSWWWATHIRTKQSKWLDQNLQDMEEKVQSVLKLLQQDGDSFAKRAEMYYKKKPELINFVEETYRAYRALADRYDHMSTELQNANNTIAYVFPEQVQFAMEEEDDELSPRFPKKTPEVSKDNIPKVPKIPKELKGFITSATNNIQPKKPTKIGTASSVAKSGLSKSEGLKEINKLQKQILALQTEKELVKSSYENGLTKYWEIDREIRELQDSVCCLQDEFGIGTIIEDDEARSLMASVVLKSCEAKLARLQEKQEKSAEEASVECRKIEDAREKLNSLKEFPHSQINEENPPGKDEPTEAVKDPKSLEQDVSNGTQERQELEALREKIKEHFDVDSTLTVTEVAEKIDELVNKVISLEDAVSSQTALIQRLRSEADELQAQIRTLEDDKSTLIDGKRDLSDKLKEMEEKLHKLQDLNRNMEVRNSNLQTHLVVAHSNVDHLPKKLHTVKLKENDQIAPSRKERCLAQVDSQKELKGGVPKLDCSLGKLLDLKPEEKDKASGKSHEEFKGQDDTPNFKGSLGDLINEKLEQLEILDEADEKLEEELKISGKLAENSNGEKAAKPNGSLWKLLNMKHEKEINMSNSSQMAHKSFAGTGMPADLKENKERLHRPNTKDVSDDSSEKFQGVKMELNVEEGASSETMNVSPIVETKQETKQEDEPDWKELFLNGIENKEKALLIEYSSVLRNYKEAKKKLSDVENKGGKSLFDVTVQLREMKNANAKKDEQIRVLRQKLNLLHARWGEENESEIPTVTESPITNKDASKNLEELLIGQLENVPEIERKLRANIEEVLEENLDFWLRFSSTFQQIPKFEAEVKDLESESVKLEEKLNRQDESSTPKYSLRSDAKPLYKHLREKHTELVVWVEKSMTMNDELKSRFSTLCDIQEEITAALKDSAETEDFSFTSYQAAKFQGEILNMKQENNKVADELQAGLDTVTSLQLQVEKSLAKLNEKFKLSGSTNSPNIQLQHSESRSRVPLRSFIFGVKPKKQKTSIFSSMYPVLHKTHQGLRATPKKGD